MCMREGTRGREQLGLRAARSPCQDHGPIHAEHDAAHHLYTIYTYIYIYIYIYTYIYIYIHTHIYIYGI